GSGDRSACGRPSHPGAAPSTGPAGENLGVRVRNLWTSALLFATMAPAGPGGGEDGVELGTISRLRALRRMMEDCADHADPPERARRWEELMRFLDMTIKVEERRMDSGAPPGSTSRSC